MKTLIFLMSMNGEMSVTLHSTRCIQDVFKNTDEFEELQLPKNGVLPEGTLEKFKEADLIMFSTSMYHFLIASQAMEAMTEIGKYMQENCPGKPVTYFMTSNFLMDVLVHEYIERWADRFGMRYIKGISIFSDDIIEDKYRADLYAWFSNVKNLILGKNLAVKRNMDIRVVLLDKSEETNALARDYETAFKRAGALVKRINMTGYDFKHCLGCQACYTTRKCCITNDEFTQLCTDIEAGTDGIVYVGELQNGFYPPIFKKFMDRHVCMGRCPADDEIITILAYHKDNTYLQGDEHLLETWSKAYTSFGGSLLIDTCEGFSSKVVDAAVSAFNENLAPYRDFYGTALRTRFADLAREIRNLEPLDYAYFKSCGDYVIRPVNQNCKPILSMADAKKSVEMKSMPVRMYRMQNKNLNVSVPERRQNKEKSIVDRVINPPYAPGGHASVDLSDDNRVASAPVSGPMMGKMMAKVGRRVGLLMNTFNTILFSTIGTLSSGHFTWSGWLFGAAVGWCTGAVITSIIPVKDTQDWVLEKTKTDGKTLKGRLIASLSTNFIVMPAMTIVMGLAMPNLSVMNIEKGIAQTESELSALQIQQYDLKLEQETLKNNRLTLKEEQTDLKLQQTELKLEQAVLQGQYDKMEIDIDWIQKSIEKASTPAEKGALNGELEAKQSSLSEMKAGIDEMQAGIDGMQEGIDGKQKGIDEIQDGINEMQTGIDNMQGGIDGMTTSITERRNAVEGIKSSIPRSLPISAVLNTIIGIVFGLFTQPFFVKRITKSVFGKNAPSE